MNCRILLKAMVCTKETHGMPGRLELLTLPASRDALINRSAFN